MAQGGTDSRASALLLDSRVDPLQHDVVLWEVAINDHAAGSGGLAMEFWMRRVYSLYAKQNRPLPPLIFLHFWDYRAEKIPKSKLMQNGTGLGSFPEQKPIIEKYQELGWSIQVLAVGNTLDKRAISQDMSLILDDVHHPSCEVLHLVASMIQQAIYKDMATCDITSVVQNSMTATNTNNPPFDIPNLAKLPPPGSIAALLIQPRVRISSFSRWKPTIGTSFRMESVHENNPLELVGIARDTRADRMASFVLPVCSEAPLKITLLEPSLKWLGLSYGEQGAFPTTKEVPAGLVPLSVNGSPVSYLSRQNRVSRGWISSWVDLSSWKVPQSSYTLSFCRTDPERKVMLNFFIGLVY